MDKVEQLSQVSEAIKSTKELEKNYVSHLFTFMAMSKKLEETTKVLDAVTKSLDNVSSADIKDVQNTKARIHKSISMVRNDFVAQVSAMMKNPNYGPELKDRLAQLLTDFKSIDQQTKPKGIFTGGAKRAGPKGRGRAKVGGSGMQSKAYEV